MVCSPLSSWLRIRNTREPLVPFGKDPEGIMPKILGMLKADGFWTYSHENMIVVCPPLTITEEELREADGYHGQGIRFCRSR